VHRPRPGLDPATEREAGDLAARAAPSRISLKFPRRRADKPDWMMNDDERLRDARRQMADRCLAAFRRLRTRVLEVLELDPATPSSEIGQERWRLGLTRVMMEDPGFVELAQRLSEYIEFRLSERPDDAPDDG
jgi:hypothetical protein